METRFKFLTVCAIVLFIAIVLALIATITSCSNENRFKTNEEGITVLSKADSSAILQLVDEAINPTVHSVKEAYYLRCATINAHENDSIFCNMPESTLKYVTTVLLNKEERVTKSSIVNEYLQNNKVYDNLSSPTPPVVPTDTINVTKEK